MSKNRLSWIFALVLLISIPAAYAQTFAGLNLYFILINAAIVFVILFLLQSILIPGKEGKEKTSMWIIVIIASLVIAFFYGQNRFIWQGPLAMFFSIKLVVNSVIISAVLYFALAFIPKLDLKSKEGNIGFWILIFVISAVIAINLSPDRFLWQQETLRSFYSYLFSGQEITRKDGTKIATGILHYNGGLFTLVSSFIVINFFLQSYLLKQGNKWVNFMMAGLFAFLMASPPASPARDVVLMGEFFFIFIFWEALKASIGKEGKMVWFSLALSVFMVMLISAALTVSSPNSRGVLGWFGCHIPIVGPNCEYSDGTTKTGEIATAGSGWTATAIIKMIVLLIISVVVLVVVVKIIQKYRSGTTGDGAGGEARGQEAPAGEATGQQAAGQNAGAVVEEAQEEPEAQGGGT